MKDHIQFFILFSLLEVLATMFHFLLVRTVDLTILIGAILYAAGMCTAYLNFRAALHQKRKKEMLESFL